MKKEDSNMTSKPLVSIVTVVYNGEEHIEKCLRSVIEQDYERIEYIVIDGASTDGTKEIIEKYKKNIVYFSSEPDKDMYSALNKGFAVASGDIVCWLNSDDYYFPGAISTVVDVFDKCEGIKWITGRKVQLNEKDQIVKIGSFRNYRQNYIKNGYYRGDALGYITQESTFWRKELFAKVGSKLNENLDYAADYELWVKMAEHAELYSINTLLGAFRVRKGQLSENKKKYLEECEKVVSIKYSCIRLLRYFVYAFSIIDNKNKIRIDANNYIPVNRYFYFD